MLVDQSSDRIRHVPPSSLWPIIESQSSIISAHSLCGLIAGRVRPSTPYDIERPQQDIDFFLPPIARRILSSQAFVQCFLAHLGKIFFRPFLPSLVSLETWPFFSSWLSSCPCSPFRELLSSFVVCLRDLSPHRGCDSPGVPFSGNAPLLFGSRMVPPL